jgi:hypothetical protein
MMKKWTPTTALVLGRHTNLAYSFPRPPYAPTVHAIVDTMACCLTLKWLTQPSITSVTLIIDDVVVPGIDIGQTSCSYTIPKLQTLNRTEQHLASEASITYSLSFKNAVGQGLATTGTKTFIYTVRTPDVNESSVLTTVQDVPHAVSSSLNCYLLLDEEHMHTNACT